MRAADMGDLELDTRPRARDSRTSEPVSVGSMFEQLVDRLFLRALQFMLGGVAFGVAFFPVRGRGSAADIATAGVLLALASGALVKRRALLAMLARRPVYTLLFPLPAVFAVAVDGGFDSVWTPLVAITVGVPATLGLPWLSLGCASIAAVGQAAAAWINRGDLAARSSSRPRSSTRSERSRRASGSRCPWRPWRTRCAIDRRSSDGCASKSCWRARRATLGRASPRSCPRPRAAA